MFSECQIILGLLYHILYMNIIEYLGYYYC